MIIDEQQSESEAPETPASGGEQAETPETEVETTEEEQQEAAATESEDGDQPGDGEETETEELLPEEGEEEIEEVEWGGKTYKVHPDLKPALMMQADYTKKTQEVADQRKALEEREQSFSQQVETLQALQADYGKLHAIEYQIDQYKNVNWDQLEEEDPVAAQRHWRTLQSLKDAKQQQASEIQRKEHEKTQEAQRENAKRTEDFQRSLAREFKDWSPQLDLQLTEFAKSRGVTDQEIASIRDVRSVRIIREAMEGVQLKEKLRKQQTAAKTKSKEQVKPLEKPAQGRAPARNGLSDDMPIDEWMKQRAKQESAKRSF